MHLVLFRTRSALSTAVLFSVVILWKADAAHAQQAASAPVIQKPETVEWVYRVRYGYEDEWYRIFRKYQVAILEEQKRSGYVKNYTIWSPSLHISEESRWDYRVVIRRASHDAPPDQLEEAIAARLFPDQQTFEREEHRRWELTLNHWDLPFHEVPVNQ